MRTEPLLVDGLAGPLVVTVNTLTGRHSVTVGGQPAVGTRRGKYTLPTANGGTVEANLRATWLDAYPVIDIAGVEHRTGPRTPVGLRILALIPLVLVAIGGLLGGAFAALAITANMMVARGPQSTPIKAALMVSTLVAAAALWLIVAVAIRTAVR
jgi:hypothetical protein